MFKAIVDRIRGSTLACAVVFGLAYFAGAELGHALSFKAHEKDIASFWPPAGLFLATLVLSRGRLWPLLLLAATVANSASDVLFHHKPMLVSIGFCVANCGEACLGAWLLRRFVGLPFTLTRIKEVLGLACLSALISTLFGATVGAGIVHLAYGNASFWPAWQSWWIGDALGVLVIAPVIFTWAAAEASFFKVIRPWRIAESAALFLGITLVTQGVYGELLPTTLIFPAILLPFLLWAALRFGPLGASAVVLVVALIGLWNTTQGRGPFAALPGQPGQQMLRAQGALAVASLCVLVLSALVAERKQAEQRRIRLIMELEQALNEIKTLRGLIPLCAWCKKIRDDQGFWQRLEDYLRAHTEAQFTHGICPQCLEMELAPTHGGPGGQRGS